MNEKPPRPNIVLLYCPRTLAPGAEKSLSSLSDRTPGANVRSAIIACGSVIQVPHLLKILEDGADAVQVVTCAKDDCQSLTGSARAEKRVEYTRWLLEGFGLGADRLGFHRARGLGGSDLANLCRHLARAIEPLGPHPMTLAKKELRA